MTDEDIKRSKELLDILNHPAFVHVVKEIVTDNQNDWAVTATLEAREELWHEQNALTKLVMKMHAIADRPRFEANKAKAKADQTELAQKL